MHHRVGDVGMKLKAERIVELKRLDREIAALGQQFGARGEFKTLAVPMIHMIGPMRADPKSRLRRTNRVIADLGEALGMRCDTRAPSCFASNCAPRQMPRNGRCSRRGT